MQLKPDLKYRTLTIDIHLQSIRVLALSKNSANGANRANRGAGNPVLGQLSGREHVGAGSEPAPTTGKKFILPGGFLFPGRTNCEILLSKTRPQPLRFSNQQVFTLKMRFGDIKKRCKKCKKCKKSLRRSLRCPPDDWTHENP